jgi:DNA invertase Pin-like site-specific DNA recombinase
MQVDDGTSLEAQRAAVERYAHGMGLELVTVIEDAGVSGSVPLAQRPGGRRVLEMIERGEVGAVIAPKLDRLFRDAEDALKVTREWDERGVAMHLLDLRVDTAS